MFNPSIPLYRVPFLIVYHRNLGYFQSLHSEGDLGNLTPFHQYTWSECLGKSIKIGFGLLWQKNLVKYKIKKNDIVIVLEILDISLPYFYIKSQIIRR